MEAQTLSSSVNRRKIAHHNFAGSSATKVPSDLHQILISYSSSPSSSPPPRSTGPSDARGRGSRNRDSVNG
ncbi:hypothetical protein TcWFU_007509 [Taenia crassiceps]|uniref:Uncharacterized protein n=1 Tax=Taenia crassiceps TaxID=6207 RepID=A0ABR4QS68_9CEST